MQCADWMCGLIGRIAAHASRPDEYGDWSLFARHFGQSVNDSLLPGSGLIALDSPNAQELPESTHSEAV